MLEPRITVPVLRVLQAFLIAGAAERLYGLQLTDQTGLKSGTLYPVLARLEKAGWVVSAWEEVDPRDVGRPRRRYYELSGVGQRAGTAALAEFIELTQRAHKPRPTAGKSRSPLWGQA